MDLIKEIQREKKELLRLRREFHMIPELGFHEFKTSELILKEIDYYGLKIKKKIAGTGISAILEGPKNGKTIMLRADMDALPISEKNEIDHISKHDGIMHACGHDGHMAIAIIVAKILSRNKDLLEGNVKFVFQPAEEEPGGAKPMIEEGVLEDPKVDALLGLHIWNYLPVGKIGIRTGPLMSSVNLFKLKIIGKGSHGAIPQDGVDAIVTSSSIINTLQTIISREISPFEPCVITIGKIKGGKAFNIIAQDVELEGTVRTMNKELNEEIPVKIERIVKDITSAFRADYRLDYKFLYPVTVNDENMCRLVSDSAIKILGKNNVVNADQTMGGEDISYFLNEIPGCYFFLGSKNISKNLDKPHHNQYFDFDEDCMAIGVEILINSIINYLNN